jgi:hypothetical protein
LVQQLKKGKIYQNFHRYQNALNILKATFYIIRP